VSILLPPAPPWRRLAAFVYDLMALIGLWFAVGVAAVAIKGGAVDIGDWRELLLLYGTLWLVMGLYYVLSWRHGGQTLGMRPWRLRVERGDGSGIDLGRGWLRYACGWLSLVPLGAGLLLCWIDRDRRALHDRLAGTRVALLPH
jgi:uncharacterized RDD family membrane protein YckC